MPPDLPAGSDCAPLHWHATARQGKPPPPQAVKARPHASSPSIWGVLYLGKITRNPRIKPFHGKIFPPKRKKTLASRFGFAYTSFRAEVVELVDTLS